MANGLRETLTYRDVKGHTGSVRVYLADTGVPVNIRLAGLGVANAIAPVTNAALQAAHGPYTTNAGPVAYGTAANFIGMEDKAVFTFAGADGALHRYQIPAPKVGIFEVDMVTVDQAQADAAALIAEFILAVVTASGAALTSFVGGVRIRRKLQRKLNIYVKVPELDEPAE